MYKKWCLQPKTVNAFFRETGWNKSASTSYPRCCPVGQPGHAMGWVAPLPTVFSLWEITGCFASEIWALTCLVAARQIVCQWKIRVCSLVGLAVPAWLCVGCWAAAARGPQPHAPQSTLWLNGHRAGSVIVRHGQLPRGSSPVFVGYVDLY